MATDLTMSANVVMFTATYTAQGTATNIPINIESYDPDVDVLLVFINGVLANDKYSISEDSASINLTNAISAGNIVNFIVLHTTYNSSEAPGKKVSEMVEISSISDSDLIHVASGGKSKRAPFTTVYSYIAGKINIADLIVVDDVPTDNSENLVTSGGVKSYVDNLVGDVETILEDLL